MNDLDLVDAVANMAIISSTELEILDIKVIMNENRILLNDGRDSLDDMRQSE